MEQKTTTLTHAEWSLMECLWDHSPRSGREAIEYMREHCGWSRSTTLTMLRRMTEKGILRCEDGPEVKLYTPLVRREDAVTRETEEFLTRVYNGSISLMMSAMTRRQKLSREEIDELYDILRRAEEDHA